MAVIETVDFSEIECVWRDPLWHIVCLNTMFYDREPILKWLSSSCKGWIKIHCAAFAFTNKTDALMFSLRWGSV